MSDDVPTDAEEEEGRALYLARREEARAAVRRMIEKSRTSVPAVMPILGIIAGAIFPGLAPMEVAA